MNTIKNKKMIVDIKQLYVIIIYSTFLFQYRFHNRYSNNRLSQITTQIITAILKLKKFV